MYCILRAIRLLVVLKTTSCGERFFSVSSNTEHAIEGLIFRGPNDGPNYVVSCPNINIVPIVDHRCKMRLAFQYVDLVVLPIEIMP